MVQYKSQHEQSDEGSKSSIKLNHRISNHVLPQRFNRYTLQ